MQATRFFFHNMNWSIDGQLISQGPFSIQGEQKYPFSISVSFLILKLESDVADYVKQIAEPAVRFFEKFYLDPTH